MDDLLINMAQGGVGGAIAYALLRRLARKKENPYKWKCPVDGCHFKVGSNDLTLTLHFAEQHEMRHKE